MTWFKPAKPDWMDEAVYERLPASIRVREVLVNVSEPGCRTKSLVVVTTLTDASEYTKADLAELYHRRWLVELDIRAIKITMGMDVLRCQSAEMVRREIAWLAVTPTAATGSAIRVRNQIETAGGRGPIEKALRPIQNGRRLPPV